MRILVAVPDDWMGEGLAHVLRAAVPGSTLVDCGKGSLLLAADPGAGAVAAAVVAYPWHSLATLRALRRRQPCAVLVVCSGAHDAATHVALLATKVAAVIADGAPPAIVGAVVQVALHGDASVQPRALWQRTDAAEEEDRPPRRLGELNLTPRQFDVLRLVASGHSNKAIADELGIGLRTVKGHVAVILRALHADDRRAAGRNARRWLARHQTLVHLGAVAP
jgi:DNA-binding NarL/FixJ family response regulator